MLLRLKQVIYFVPGAANFYEYDASGQGLQFKTPKVPYTTLILVRRPKNPHRRRWPQMLMPKRVKEGRRKMMRGRMKGPSTQGNMISFGEFGLVATEPSWISSRQIEAARIAMTRHIKRGGKVWIRIFPDKSYTKKPL